MALTNNAEGGANGVTPTTGDSGSGTPWSAVVKGGSSTLQYSTAHPAHGSLAYQMATRAVSESAYLGWDNVSAMAAAYFRVYIYWDVTPVSHSFVELKTLSGTILGYVGCSSAQKLSIRNGSNETGIWTTTATLAAATLYRIEFYCAPGGATGQMQARLYAGDATAVIEDSGLQTVTHSASATTLQTVRFGPAINPNPNQPSSTGYVWMDDMGAFDTAWMGPAASSVQFARPDADLTVGGWSPSTGTTLYGTIDETPASDTDYISSPSS